MSQVGISSRPGTQQSLGRGPTMALPEIQHPLSRMGNPGNMDIRGMSRSGDRPTSMQSGRPLGNESNYMIPKRLSTSGGRQSRQNSGGKFNNAAPVNIETIPEGVEIMMGDPSKTKMPIFGNRVETATGSRLQTGNGHRVASRLSTASAQARLEIDELEAILKEKVRHNFIEVKKRFKDNDPENKGNVSKDALYRIVLTLLNRPVNGNQFGRLMERIGLKDRTVVSVQEFAAVFREAGSEEYPRWIDPVQRQVAERGVMSAVQVNAHLKEKARNAQLSELVPDLTSLLIKPEFRSALLRAGLPMEDAEFEKLWCRYDTDGTGAVTGEKLLKKLGGAPATAGPDRAASAEAGMSESGRPLRKKELERQRSIDIERWMKKKFREGFSDMKQAFTSADKDHSGHVSFDVFLDVLGRLGLRLHKEHLGDFLARCSVEPSKTGVSYRDFLHRFQDRSEAGMAHKILTNPKHRYNRLGSPGGQSTLSAVEASIMNMFQKDFLSLLGTFHKIDNWGTDRISQQEFQAAIESRFDLELSAEQYSRFVDHVPLDQDGNVRYADFMAQFDTKLEREAKMRAGRPQASLFEGDEFANMDKVTVFALPRDPSPQPAGDIDRLVVTPVPARDDDDMFAPQTDKRSAHELFLVIKDLLKKDYQAVEQMFIDIDELNTRRLSQEMMYHLLKRFQVTPTVTRGEIRDIWKTFITNTDRTLDFQQFTRHFGYSLKSAAFPNAKVQPPKRGDNDYMIRSRKLNCAADMIQDNLRAKIDYMWEDLRREFVGMDPYATGFVMIDEFRDVLRELCIHLTDHETEMLVRKFRTGKDNRVSYIEFLKPYASRRDVWRHGNNMLSLLQHPVSELPITDVVEPPQKGLHGLTAKLRQKLAGGEWKNLRRAFKKLDQQNSGLLSLPEFRSVLKLANVILDEEEVYQLMSQFDSEMSGKVSYQRFLSETFRSNDRQTPLR